MNYSLLRAIAASFLAAILAGMCPPIKVKMVEMMIKISAATGSNCATFAKAVIL